MSDSKSASCGGGISAGAVIAFIISWKLWHSVVWAFLASVLGWGYVIYAAIYYLDQIKGWLG